MEININENPPTLEEIEKTKIKILNPTIYSLKGIQYSYFLLDILRIPFFIFELIYLFFSKRSAMRKLNSYSAEILFDYSKNTVVQNYINKVKLLNRDLLQIEFDMLQNRIHFNKNSGWSHIKDKAVIWLI